MDGFQLEGDVESNTTMKRTLISSPYHIGSKLPFSIAPFESDEIEVLHERDPHLSDEQNEIINVCTGVVRSVCQSVNEKKLPVVYSGDCLAPIAIITALQKCEIDPTLIWFDAHGDFNTPETSWTGYLAGMGVAMLAGRGDLTLLNKMGTRPLSENKIFLVDGRHLDIKEAELIKKSDIHHFTLSELALNLSKINGPVYLHIDVDVINPNEMPAMLWPAAGGPSIKEVISTAKLAASLDLRAMSVGVTLEPNSSEVSKAVDTASRLIEVLEE